MDQAPEPAVGRTLSQRATLHRRAFGEMVIAARHIAGVSQEDLAARVGCERRTIMRIEKGQAPVTLELVEAVANALGIEPEDFLGSLTTPRIDEETFRQMMRESVDTLHQKLRQKLVNRTRAALSRDAVMDLLLPLANLPDDELAVVTRLLNSRVRDLYDPKPDASGNYIINASNVPPMFPRAARE